MGGPSVLALVPVVFVLGFKHGLDPDHLAAIDGLTRYNAQAGQRRPRFVGLLFSLGHGAAVVLVAFLFATVLKHARVPEWTAASGTAFSSAFLFLLGGLNLRSALRSEVSHHFRPIGLRSSFLGGLFRTGNPLLIACIGALFAISFDTLSQAALLSLVGSTLAGAALAACLALFFMLGMTMPDALNGLWVSGLIHRANRRAAIASRVMGAAFGFISVLVGVSELFQSGPGAPRGLVDEWRLLVGLSIVAACALAFWLSLRLSSGEPKEGLTLRPTEVPIFGHPKFGTRLMQAKQSVGIDLPMKALVWQEAAGRTWLGYNEPAWVAARHGLGVDQEKTIQAMSAGLAAQAKEATG